MLKKIISGGQTGADQAALDVVIETGIPHGGDPKGQADRSGATSSPVRIYGDAYGQL
jgi:hypothetical protein